jgi:5-(carboxyamino)imidazole ribonucleotide synthase
VSYAERVILPGSTIGILGGGQLGRMMAMAARAMGYRVQVLDPDPSCPARFVVDACFEAGWDDARAAADMARGCDVVTLEIEQVAIASLEAAQAFAPVRPGPAVLTIIQDKITQKDWLRAHNVPIGEYRAARGADELREAVRALGGKCFVKGARGGYDGRSQVKLGFDKPPEDADIDAAWKSLGGQPVIVERAIELQQEISVLVARSPRGEMKAFPPATNHHERQILEWSVIPAEISPSMEAEAREIALRIAGEMNLEGLLAVEMFVTTDADLKVNELAPRPHNSYHASERACDTSQFEQAIRAVCNLPLGDVDVVQPAAIINLLGDLWAEREPHFDAALSVPGVRLHLYEKQRPRSGRKMGHLSASGKTPQDAVGRVMEAKELL